MYILWIMLAFVVMYIIRMIKGPSLWDRLLGMNLVATKIIMMIVSYASIHGIAYVLDFAMIYALSGFVGTIFIALFLLERQKGGKE